MNLDSDIKTILFHATNTTRKDKKDKKDKKDNKDTTYYTNKKTNIPHIRVDASSWTFSEDVYSPENQLQVIQCIHDNSYNFIDNTSKIALQQINKKLYSYKQQDVLKHHYDTTSFIYLQHVIDTMLESELKCYYCQMSMNVLYDISRESKQWTVDRIDNNLGHNVDNYYLACLECNLKRRCRNDDKFRLYKQMRLVKLE